MPQVDFAPFHYYPLLKTGVAELIAYRELSQPLKERIIPIFELSQRGTDDNLDASLAELREFTADFPFILDLSKEPAPEPYRFPGEDPVKIQRDTAAKNAYDALLASLLNPNEGFSAWRNLASTFPNAIPAVQYTDPTSQQRQILRQAALLSHGDKSLAIRVTEEYAGPLASIISQIISILRSPSQLLIIADCGQRRQRLQQRAQFAGELLTRIRSDTDIAEQALLRSVCISSWYAKPSEQGLSTYISQDWDLWREARGYFPFAFGDYGAMHRHRRLNTYVPSDWVATVTIPRDGDWRAYKHTNSSDRAGWIEGSARLVNDGTTFQNAPLCWGRGMIERAAAGDLSATDRVSTWHAVRVNLHMTRQIIAAESNVVGASGDDD